MAISKESVRKFFASLVEVAQYGPPPPMREELDEFLAGGLSAAEAERLRDGLLLYLELAASALELFPISKEAAPALTPAQWAEDVAKLRQRLGLDDVNVK